VAGTGIFSFVAESIEDARVVSCHDLPQVSPQEWDCGCVTEVYVTDRNALEGERPFEMRLARPCDSEACCLPAEQGRSEG